MWAISAMNPLPRAAGSCWTVTVARKMVAWLPSPPRTVQREPLARLLWPPVTEQRSPDAVLDEPPETEQDSPFIEFSRSYR